MTPRDWRTWHGEYDQAGSRLQRRLAVVQQCIRAALDALPSGPIRAISLCAGEGRDLLGVLADHARAKDVVARLVELDPELAKSARRAAPAGVEVICGDAARTDACAGAVPADLVLVCGVFGNVSDADVERTVRTVPSLCAPGAFAIWTRHRRAPDLTVDIRRWFRECGFEQIEFVGPDDLLFGVGMNRLSGPPAPFEPGVRMFTFR